MPTSIHEGDHVFKGQVVPDSLVMPNGCVTSASVQTAANISADKLSHREYVTYSQANVTAAAETRTVFVARKAGLITEVAAGSIAAAIGDSTVTVDVKKNNTSVLSSTITLDSSNTARTPETGSVNPAQDDLVAGDWVEVVVTVSAGTGTLPTGLFVQITVEQDGV